MMSLKPNTLNRLTLTAGVSGNFCPDNEKTSSAGQSEAAIYLDHHQPVLVWIMSTYGGHYSHHSGVRGTEHRGVSVEGLITRSRALIF